jgi:pantoate--beta-alanine ligase
MGAFHEGHLSLMRTAKQNHESAVVSIFVNPTQFGAGEDFERYPRSFDRDAQLAEAAGVDVIFAPSVEEMYPRRSTEIVVHEVTDRWEGAARPGHFTGVATVVAKLFSIVQPTAAYFGLKDLQQCMVIRRMTADLNLPVALKFEETVRDSDGLALSSRNIYLSPSQREIAPSLYFELRTITDRILSGEANVDALILESNNRLRNLGFAVDYLEVVDLNTMAPVRKFDGDAAVIVAAKLGTTRLIDNIRILSK